MNEPATSTYDSLVLIPIQTRPIEEVLAIAHHHSHPRHDLFGAPVVDTSKCSSREMNTAQIDQCEGVIAMGAVEPVLQGIRNKRKERPKLEGTWILEQRHGTLEFRRTAAACANRPRTERALAGRGLEVQMCEGRPTKKAEIHNTEAPNPATES